MSRQYPSVFQDLYYNSYNQVSRYTLFKTAKDSKHFVQRLRLAKSLLVHDGCVNTISWSDTGEYILSGSDDQHLCITNGSTYKVLTSVHTAHKANIFSAKFLPCTGDRQVISCSGDGVIIFTELERANESSENCFNCHYGTAYKIVTVPKDAHTFLSCGEDGTVRWFDLRIKNRCSAESCKQDILIDCKNAVTALAVNPVFPYQVATGCADSTVRIYDRRMLGTRATGNYHGGKIGQVGLSCKFTVPEFQGQSHRITSLVYSPDAKEALVSYSSDYLYLFGINGGEPNSPQALRSPGWGPLAGRKEGSATPPMKRLRLRGDWSDTGPNARPESETRADGSRRSVLHVSLIQHVSDVLIRMLNDSTRQQRRAATTTAVRRRSSAPAPIPTLDEDADRPSSTISSTNTNLPSFLASQSLVDPLGGEDNDDSAAMSAESSPLPPHVDFSSDSETPDASRCPSVPPRPKSPLPEQSLEGDVASVSDSPHFSDLEQPTVSIHYNPQGVNSGLIRVNPAGSSPSGSNLPPVNDVDMAFFPEEYREQTSSVELATAVSSPTSTDNVFEDDDVDLAMPGTSAAKLTKHRRHPPRQSNPEDYETENDDDEEDEQQDLGSSDEESIADIMTPARDSGSIRTRWHRSVDMLRSMKESFAERYRNSENEEADCCPARELPEPTLLRKFVGHRNARTMIKESNFWGDDYVMSGSDCGHIFVWNRHTADLVMVMEADKHVVNCIQPHPFDPVLASSGIDYDIKLWAPLGEESNFDEKFAAEIMRRNEVMLEETRDTITVPASFMIRMLASLNNIRQGQTLRGGLARLRQSRSAASGESP